MLNNTVDHPQALALLILSGLLAGPIILVAFWRERRRPPGPLWALAHLGTVQLALLWLGFIPLALLNRALGEPLVVVFGSYSKATSLIDYVAAVNLSAACLILLRALLSSRLSWCLKSPGLLFGILLTVTAAKEAGLGKPAFGSYPSDLLHGPFVPMAYSLAGLLVLSTILVVARAGERVKRHPAARFSLMIVSAPHVVGLGLTTAVLAQHPLFEEVAELAFSAALLQILMATATLIRPAPLSLVPQTAVTVR